MRFRLMRRTRLSREAQRTQKRLEYLYAVFMVPALLIKGLQVINSLRQS